MRRPDLRIPTLLALIAVGVGVARAQVKPIDALEIGLQTGETGPAFSLPDQTGHHWDLASLTGSKGLILVFFRSADW